MARKRKQAILTVTVTLKPGLTLRDAKREIRALVNDACSYSHQLGAVRVKRIDTGRMLPPAKPRAKRKDPEQLALFEGPT